MNFSLNTDQQAALARMNDWLAGADLFFLLSGSAGTGKTYSMKALLDGFKGRVIFTAPTNKATKVLRDTLTSDTYKPECRTIYSLLGLKMEANGEVKELAAPEDPLDLSLYKLVVVDEASMINAALWRHIVNAAECFDIPVLFMGDPAQLPPVGERTSPVWDIERTAALSKVMRHDNQILDLATRIRDSLGKAFPNVKLAEAHADGEGVWMSGGQAFENRLLEAASLGEFSKPNRAKAIAWRNVTVDKLNRLIRNRIFGQVDRPWVEDDRIILTGPAKAIDGQIIATTDDEGRVCSASRHTHQLYPSMKVWNLSVTLDDNRQVPLHVLHEDSFEDFNLECQRLAEAARADRRKWKHFWAFKDAFHTIRHAYAITAHRSQGSTYDSAFVDWRDILSNPDKPEAYRCLYVACTRPKKRLILN